MSKKQMIIMVLANALSVCIIATIASTAVTGKMLQSQTSVASEMSTGAQANEFTKVPDEPSTSMKEVKELITKAPESETATESETISKSENASESESTAKTEVDAEQEEYSDSRRLDQKFLNQDDDFRWVFIRDDLGQVENAYRITLDSDKIKNASPGEIIREWSFNYSDKAKDRIVISVPKLYDCGVATNALKDYGVLEVFCYYIAGGQFEPILANAELLIFDKSAFDNGQKFTIITTPLGNYTGATYTITTIPTLTYEYTSIEYSTVEDALAETIYPACYESAYALSNHWDKERYFGAATFTKNSVNFGIGELAALLERADQCNILGRKLAADYLNELGATYNVEIDKYESGSLSFAMTEFCNEISGPIAGKYTMEHGCNGFIYFYPKDRRGSVIAVTKDRIYVGVSSRDELWDENIDVANDRLYIGTYFVDSSSDPELIEIDGDAYLTLTRDTLNQLLRLLAQANINWSDITARNLGLNG